MSKNEKVRVLRDIHGYLALFRLIGITLAATVVAIILTLTTN